MSHLFTPFQIGCMTVPNRLIMAPMTRSRSDEDGVPGDIMAKYYGQRASAGLIITEGVFRSPPVRGMCVHQESKLMRKPPPGRK